MPCSKKTLFNYPAPLMGSKSKEKTLLKKQFASSLPRFRVTAALHSWRSPCLFAFLLLRP